MWFVSLGNGLGSIIPMSGKNYFFCKYNFAFKIDLWWSLKVLKGDESVSIFLCDSISLSVMFDRSMIGILYLNGTILSRVIYQVFILQKNEIDFKVKRMYLLVPTPQI